MRTIEEIKAYMKQNNITYQQLSDDSGIPLNTLKNIFRLKTRNPRIDTMRAIERALGLTAELEDMPNEAAKLINAISHLTDEECEEVSRYIDFVISKRK